MLELKWSKDFLATRLSVTFPIWFEDETNVFPDTGWNDFGLVVLQWWLSELECVYQAEEAEFELCFMDGPFLISCKKDYNDVHMRFMNQRGSGTVEFERDISYEELQRMVTNVAEGVLQHIKERGITCVEAEKLGCLVSRNNAERIQ